MLVMFKEKNGAQMIEHAVLKIGYEVKITHQNVRKKMGGV